jgi:hypothetical protein
MSDFSEHPLKIDDFDVNARMVPIDELGNYDDLSSWGQWEHGELVDLDASERTAALRSFRGSSWAARAIEWTPQTVPSIVVVTLSDGTTAIADGRGRTNYAIGMAWETMPVTFLTAKSRRR